MAEEQGLQKEGRFMGTERKGLPRCQPIGMLAQNEGNCRVGSYLSQR